MSKQKLPPQCIIFSDTHVGCQLGLCDCSSRGAIRFDSGGLYKPNKIQQEIYKAWRYTWDVWVPEVTKGEPYYVIMNGDAIDGRHHGSTTQFSQNLNDQILHAEHIIGREIQKATHYFHLRGTEAHVGQSGENEEMLARALGAIPNDAGQYARFDLWSMVGKGLIHVLHHIGTSSSRIYSSTALMKELMDLYMESAKMRQQPPDAVVRSHRHSYLEVKMPTDGGRAFSLTTPGWQGKTPFVFKIGGARVSVPEVGAVYLRWNKHEGLYSRAFIHSLARTRVEE